MEVNCRIAQYALSAAICIIGLCFWRSTMYRVLIFSFLIGAFLSQAGVFAAMPIQVDVGNGAVKAGWTAMTGSLGNDGVVTVDGVTFTASCYLAGDEKWRNYSGGDIGSDYFDCDNGYGNPDGSIILTIANLPAGRYTFTSYHNYSLPDYRCPLDIIVSGGISSATTATNVSVTQNTVDDNGLGSGTVEFIATGGSDVIVEFVPTCDTRPEGMMCLNGFALDQLGTIVEFAQATSGDTENIGTVDIDVTLSEAESETVTVNYAVTGGTADGGGIDYTIAASPLTFSPGQLSRPIQLTINDDAPEEDETVEITLTGASGGAVSLGSVTVHTYTIIDPRPDVGFDTGTSIGDEDATPATVAVSLSHAWSETVTVGYSVTGGTATGGGVDYTLANGMLTFDPCEITENISIAIVDDPNSEGPETIEIRLSVPTNAKLGLSEHTFTINDDELGLTFINSLGMEFELIPAGTFIMGEGDGHRIQDMGSLDYDEQPAHLVTITKPFYILKDTVSDSHYQQLFPGSDASDVSWEDANSFSTWLSNLESKTYKLPTEAQWEYVFENPGGVENMSGREWMRDWHGEYPHNPVTDPVGPVNGILKVIRDDGINRWSLPTNAVYQPLQLPEAGACAFRLVFEYDPPEQPHVLPEPFVQSAIKQSTAPALQGPDPGVPYFHVRYSMPIPPDNSDAGLASMLGCDPIVTAHSHSPGFEVLPNGDALAVWFTGGSEYGPEVRFCQARLRYGSDQWDMPEILYDMKRMNDTSGMLWTEDDGTIRFFGGGRIDNDEKRPFVLATSTDNGATWILKRPVFPVPASSFTAQPVVDAWRQNSTTMYMVTDGASSDSIVWRSTDNGVTWYDMGGRTNGRHSTIVPIDNSGTLLSYGGKNSDISGWMPWNKSYDWGATWPDEGPTVFPALGSNQRPSLIRLANGKLAFCSDAQHKDDSKPPGSTYGYGCIVGISDNNGLTWTIKNLPVTLPHESDRDYGTLGYSTIRQAPSGVLHILTTMTHPCLHYELNEAWIFSGDGDIPPETTGGTVNPYSENYPGGALKASWSARTCPNGRYLLHGVSTSYYEDGTTEHEATYVNGRKSSVENFYGPDGMKIWSWNHDDSNNVSIWRHYWSSGYKRIESRWNNSPTPRDLPARNFSGFEANGDSYHWSLCGKSEKAYTFSDGGYIGETTLPPDEGHITADITGDCAVNENDLRVLALDWLEAGYYIPTTEPNSDGLLLHFMFEDSSGSFVTDSSGNDRYGYFFVDVDGAGGDVGTRSEVGRTGKSFHFWPGLGAAGIALDPIVFTSGGISQEITVALWIKNTHVDETPDSDAYMWEFRQWDGVSVDAGARVLAVETTDRNGNFVFRDDSENTSYGLDWSGQTEWTHYGFVRDADNLLTYVNGSLEATGNSSGNPMAAPGLLYLGVSADRASGNANGLHDGFTGNIDDFKIYDYALSENEILNVVNDGSDAYIPVDSLADLYEDGAIDFKDLAVLGSEWRQGI